MRHDYRALVDQIAGENKLFGYNNTIINQISLIRWLLGEFYFTKVFTQRVTWFWISFNVFSATIVIWHSVSYIIFTPHLDISTLLTCNEVLITMLSLLVMVPIGSYLFRNGIAEALKALDQFSLRELPSDLNVQQPHQMEIISRNTSKYTWTEAYAAGLTQMFFCTAFIISTYYDLIMEYDVNKLSNPRYYIYPLYCENIDTLSQFSFATYLQIVSCVPISTMYFIFPFFSIVVMKEFNNKFQILSDFLDNKSKLFEHNYEKIMNIDHLHHHSVIDGKFQLEDSLLNDIHSCAKYHQHLLRGLAHLRVYIECNMSISLFFFLYIEIFLIYLFTLLKDDEILQKARYIEHAIVICVMFVVNCWVGSSYTDMGEMFNDMVYDIPWYYLSSSTRKSVHLLLYQAQVTIQFKACRIYPLNMAFFMRSCNNVYSIVNLLRRGITYKF